MNYDVCVIHVCIKDRPSRWRTLLNTGIALVLWSTQTTYCRRLLVC